MASVNEKLISYGGEETDLAYRISRYTPATLTHVSDAIVLRTGHPSAIAHARRLEQFGRSNFQILNHDVKKFILPYKLYKQPAFLCYPIYIFLVIARSVLKYPLLLVGSRTTFRLLLGFYIYIGIYGFYTFYKDEINER